MTEPVHKLGEVLRAAREAKGVDLARVERETKIRERYLIALESGDYRDLPGSVYTKGFLRNYGAYLDLDPEELIDLYRIETSVALDRPGLAVTPRPLAPKRSRAFVVTPGAIVAAILTILVGGFIAYLGYQLVTFARMPELRITEPPGNVSGHTDLRITLRGVTAPNASVSVDNLRENPTVTADADGRFEVTVSLVPGSNVVVVEADDPVTGRTSEPVERTIVVVTAVASPSAAPAPLSVTEPAADATVAGPVPISGNAAPGAGVTVSATLVEPPIVGFELTDAAGAPVEVDPVPPSPPEPIELTADAAGAFAGSLALPAGTWEVAVAVDGIDPVTRRVVVGGGDRLTAVLRISGGESYLDLDEDGVRMANISGNIATDGERIELAADVTLRIRVGNAGAVALTVDGVDLGTMGEAGQVVEWRVTRAGD